MSIESLLIAFGILTALAPFSGIPMSWLEIALPLIGIAVGLVGYRLRMRRKAAESFAASTKPAVV